MTRQEAIKILAVLKAAYPNFYKNMTKEEAQGTISVWATQFNGMPAGVVMLAVNKLISTNTFPPSINEVKERIRSLYWEAWTMLDNHKKATEGIKLRHAATGEVETIYRGEVLDPKTLQAVKDILAVCEPMRTRLTIEPSLGDLLGGMSDYLSLSAPADTESDTLKRIGK